jgi:hypothetical protein
MVKKHTTHSNVSSPVDETEEATSLGGRTFLADEPIRNAVHGGKPGYLVKVCLTSYRALPLSCIEKIELKVDGELIHPDQMRFILNGYSHRLQELPRLPHIFWFILDYADLFIESARPLSPGKHLVEGLLVTVEPYVTAGRYSFYNPSTKRLTVAGEL